MDFSTGLSEGERRKAITFLLVSVLIQPTQSVEMPSVTNFILLK